MRFSKTRYVCESGFELIEEIVSGQWREAFFLTCSVHWIQVDELMRLLADANAAREECELRYQTLTTIKVKAHLPAFARV